VSIVGEKEGRANHARRRARPGAVRVVHSAARTRLVLSGDVDLSMNAELMATATEVERAALPVEVDTRDVTFMDSTAVAMLARLAYRLPQRLQMIEPTDLVRFFLDVTQLGDIVDVVDHDPGFPGGTSPAGPPVAV
jgi:anti-sigma B factor antagonist